MPEARLTRPPTGISCHSLLLYPTATVSRERKRNAGNHCLSTSIGVLRFRVFMACWTSNLSRTAFRKLESARVCFLGSESGGGLAGIKLGSETASIRAGTMIGVCCGGGGH